MGDNSRESNRLPVLRWWVAAVAAVVIALLTAGALWWLLAEAQAGDTDRAGTRIDAIRTGLSVGAGLAALSGLLLAFRRQRATEQAASDANHDATERRITELYTAAAEQLGSDKAPVRLAGLYALERLAQANPAHRQTIVDVICAYLRMPFTPPDDGGEGVDEAEKAYARVELEVRLAAQHILADHLRPTSISDEPDPKFWADTSINLARAMLFDLDFMRCRVADADFSRATFTGGITMFVEVTFTGTVNFCGSTFIHPVNFGGATFTDIASFGGASFSGFDPGLYGIRAADREFSEWPEGWRVEADPGGGLGRLVRDDDSTPEVGEDGSDPAVVGG